MKSFICTTLVGKTCISKVNSFPCNAIVRFNCFFNAVCWLYIILHKTNFASHTIFKKNVCLPPLSPQFARPPLRGAAKATRMIILQKSDMFYFNKRIFEITACCQIKAEICVVSVGTAGNELWHLNQQLAEGLCPSNSFVNRLSQYAMICVQLLRLLSPRRHTRTVSASTSGH